MLLGQTERPAEKLSESIGVARVHTFPFPRIPAITFCKTALVTVNGFQDTRALPINLLIIQESVSEQGPFLFLYLRISAGIQWLPCPSPLRAETLSSLS